MDGLRKRKSVAFTPAFTLVEMILVIGIIGYLIAILMPVLADARALAERTQCAANLKQIGYAIALYADDNRGWIPRDATLNRPDREPWPLLLGKYLTGKPLTTADLPSVPTLQCPSHPLNDIPTGYVINAFAMETAPNWAPDGPIQITTIRNSSELPWMFDATNNFPLRDFSLPDKIYGVEFHDAYSPLHLPDGDRHRISDDRHYKNVANVLYLDTHVGIINKGTLKLEMLDDHVDHRATTPPATTQ